MSIFIYLLFSLILFRNNRYWPFFFFFYVAQLWAIISCYYIEQGIFITEQERYSFETGATYRLVIENLVFFSSALIVLRFLPKSKVSSEKLTLTPKANSMYDLLLYFLFIVSILFFVDTLITKIKYNDAFNRFNYYDYSILIKYPIINVFLSYISLTSFLLGILFLINKKSSKKSLKKKIIIFISLILILLGNILQGNKFSAIYLNLLLFLIPFLTTVKINFSKKTIKYMLSVFIGVSIFIGVVFNLTVKEYTQMFGKDEAISFTLYRTLGLQGHVWWGTDYFSQKLSSYEKEQNLKNELDVILLKSDGKYTSGLNALMLLVSPKIGAAYIEKGISFTMGFPALLNTLFSPVLTFIALIILGILFGCFVYWFNKSIISTNLLNILILGYIYIYGVIQFFSMGRTSYLFNIKTYILLVLVIYLNLCFFSFKKGRKNKYKNSYALDKF